jgi:hypothetical protein
MIVSPDMFSEVYRKSLATDTKGGTSLLVITSSYIINSVHIIISYI